MTEVQQIVSLINDFRERTVGDAAEDQVEMLLDYIEACAHPQTFAAFLDANMTIAGIPASHHGCGPRGRRAAIIRGNS